jgi:hypothetical protein
MIALFLYMMFIVTPLRKLGTIARQTFETKQDTLLLSRVGSAGIADRLHGVQFLSLVAYAWNVYYLVGYAVCFRRIYEAETGRLSSLKTKKRNPAIRSLTIRFINPQ